MRARLLLVSIAIWGTTAGVAPGGQQDEGDNTGTSPINFTYGTQFRYVNSFPLMVTGETKKK